MQRMINNFYKPSLNFPIKYNYGFVENITNTIYIVLNTLHSFYSFLAALR